jgi:hypothetical protein
MVNIGHTQLHTYPSEGVERMTDGAALARKELTLVRGGNYRFSSASEKLSDLWQIGRSEVGIQQRGGGHASYALAIVPELALARTRANRAQISVCSRAQTAFTLW